MDGLNDGPIIAVIAVVERQDQRAVVLAVVGYFSADLVLDLIKKTSRPPDALTQRRGERPAVQLAQAQCPQVIVQHQALIVDRVLRKRAVLVDQVGGLRLQSRAPQLGPLGGPFELGEKQPDCPQAHRLADAVVVLLTQCIREVGRNALARDGDHLRQVRHALRRGGRTIEKAVQAETPGHHPQAGFLAAFPVGPMVRRIGLTPTFDQPPEGFGVTCVASAPTGANQHICESEPAGFPDRLNVAGAEIRYLAPMAIGGDAFAREWIEMPVRREACFDRGMGKIAQPTGHHVIGHCDQRRDVMIPLFQERLIARTIVRCEEETRRAAAAVIQVGFGGGESSRT